MMSVKYRHTTGNSVGVASAQWSYLVVEKTKKQKPIYPNICINKQQSKNVSSSDASVLRYANFTSSHDAPKLEEAKNKKKQKQKGEVSSPYNIT